MGAKAMPPPASRDCTVSSTLNPNPSYGAWTRRYHAVLFPVTAFVCDVLPEGQRESTRTELFYEVRASA